MIAATDDPTLNARIARLAQRKRIWVNTATGRRTGDVILPAVVRRGDLLLAVSTGGASPLLAGRIRRQLENRFGHEYDSLLQLLSRARRQVEKSVPARARQRAYQALTSAEMTRLLRRGERSAAWRLAKKILKKFVNRKP